MPSSGQPTQAVILAGGQGVRLRPLTDNLPKPLIPFHGQPFLGYLLHQVKEQGIEEVVLLIGYLGHMVKEFCGDGTDWGLKIKYVESPVEAETGTRMRDAAPELESHFLLMYCDNYWPMDLTQMWQSFQESGTLGMLTVYANRDGYTRNNLLTEGSGRITSYDPTRSASGLNGVDIGYAILSKDVLKHLPTDNISFEHNVYPALTSRGALLGFRTEHRYYSVGSHERLPLTESFLQPQRAIILDRDGTLNERPPKAQYVTTWAKFKWLPGTLEALSMLVRAGYKIIIVTNQSGIAREIMTEDDLATVHDHMKTDMASAGVSVDAIYYCPHGWDDGCFCRKPSPGMLFQAQRDFHLDLTKTTFVGDDERDVEAGKAAGCLTDLVKPGRSLMDIVREYLSQDKVSGYD